MWAMRLSVCLWIYNLHPLAWGISDLVLPKVSTLNVIPYSMALFSLMNLRCSLWMACYCDFLNHMRLSDLAGDGKKLGVSISLAAVFCNTCEFRTWPSLQSRPFIQSSILQMAGHVVPICCFRVRPLTLTKTQMHHSQPLVISLTADS